MSGNGRNTAVVSRDYRPDPDYCARALEVLLKKSVNEGGPAAAPNDAERRSNAIRAKTSIPERP
jgi:hypothetical protein